MANVAVKTSFVTPPRPTLTAFTDVTNDYLSWAVS